MATSSDGGGSGEQRRLLSIPKEGERIIAPTRRPDGTLRKAIRIRAGYVPQEEVAIYQSRGALMRKSGPDVPPGYDPAIDAKPKTKSAKRNERRKEKRQQASLASMNDKGKGLDAEEAKVGENDCVLSSETNEQLDAVDSVTEQISGIAISETPVMIATPSTDAVDNSKSESTGPDIDKKIRALKKKIRLAEAQLQADPEKLKPEQQEKTKKIEGWREELKLLEDKRASLAS